MILTCATLSGVAQVKSEDKPKRIFTAEELQKSEETIKRAETYFREGEILIQDRDVTSARKKFDLAVETILLSGLNVQEFENLQKYYNSLVERIFKLEVFSSQPLPTEKEKVKTTTPQAGFTEQKFEASPLDELAKLELSEEEKYVYVRPLPNKKQEDALLGNKPPQQTNGKVQIVMDWFQENLHDPYSMRIVRWSKVEKELVAREPYWVVRVRVRAKNTFGAYVLSDYVFFIRKNKIVRYSS